MNEGATKYVKRFRDAFFRRRGKKHRALSTAEHRADFAIGQAFYAKILVSKPKLFARS